MLRRINLARLLPHDIVKRLLIISIALTSCLDFEFESPYEDINGIYLEHVASYWYYGTQISVKNNRGYIWCSDVGLTSYDFTHNDSISILSTYQTSGFVYDFEIVGEHAYIVGSPPGLEVVSFTDSQPHLLGALSMDEVYKIRVRGNHAYILGTHQLYIVDVTDKTSPLHVGGYEFSSVMMQCVEIDSAYVYLSSDSAFYILDITQPTAPNLVVSLSYNDTFPSPRAFGVSRGYVYFSISTDLHKISAYEIFYASGLKKTSEMECPVYFLELLFHDSYAPAVLPMPYIMLLDLGRPSLPSIAETSALNSTPWDGAFAMPYIYLLTPDLDIIEIKQVGQ